MSSFWLMVIGQNPVTVRREVREAHSRLYKSKAEGEGETHVVLRSVGLDQKFVQVNVDGDRKIRKYQDESVLSDPFESWKTAFIEVLAAPPLVSASLDLSSTQAVTRRPCQRNVTPAFAVQWPKTVFARRSMRETGLCLWFERGEVAVGHLVKALCSLVVHGCEVESTLAL